MDTHLMECRLMAQFTAWLPGMLDLYGTITGGIVWSLRAGQWLTTDKMLYQD